MGRIVTWSVCGGRIVKAPYGPEVASVAQKVASVLLFIGGLLKLSVDEPNSSEDGTFGSNVKSRSSERTDTAQRMTFIAQFCDLQVEIRYF